jgi:hypothetical protein
VGYGKWRPLPKAKPAPAQVAKIDEDDDAQSDTPVLHRKHHADDSPARQGRLSSGSGSGFGPRLQCAAPDPDRPTLHKGGDASASGTGGDSDTLRLNNSGSAIERRTPARPAIPTAPSFITPIDSSSIRGSASADDSSNPEAQKEKEGRR